MVTPNALLDFLNPLQTNTALYKSLTDLVTAKEGSAATIDKSR